MEISFYNVVTAAINGSSTHSFISLAEASKKARIQLPFAEDEIKKRFNRFISFFQGDSPFGKLEAYIKLEQLGEGSYATVFKGYSK